MPTVAGGTGTPQLNANKANIAPVQPVQQTLKDKAVSALSGGDIMGGKDSSGGYMKGGFLSDLGDILQTPQYFATGLLSGKNPIQAVKEKLTPSKAMNLSGVGGLAADIFLDPLNLAAGLGLLSKGAKIAKAGELVTALEKAKQIVSVENIGGKVIGAVTKPFRDIVGPALEPVARKALTGEEVLSGAEKLRATQIAKGGVSVSENEAKIRESLKPFTQILSEKIDAFPVFGPIKKLFTDKPPESYLGARSGLEAGIEAGRQKALETGEYLTKGLSEADQVAVGKLMVGEVLEKVPDKLRLIAGLARRSVDSLSQELASELKLGGFGGGKESVAQTILDNIGHYMPTEYMEFVKNPNSWADFMLGSKKSRIITTFLEHKKDLSPEIRAKLGEIIAPAYPVAKRMEQVSQSIETSKFFRWVNKNFAMDIGKVAENPSGVSDKLHSAIKDLQSMAKESHLTEKEILAKGFVKLQDAPSLGILAGKYVPKTIADSINAIGKVTVSGGQAGAIMQVYRKFLGLWKYGKVILNPATQFRNLFSNWVLMDLGHYPVYSPWGAKNFVEALTDYHKQSEVYQQARKFGLLGATYFGEEIKPFLKAVEENPTGNPLVRFAKAFMRTTLGTAPRKMYEGIEEGSKLAMFKWRLAEGDTPKLAAEYAKKWLFDYRNVPAGIDLLRSVPFGFPFITFTYKSVPRVAETLVKSPGTISKYFKTFAAIEGKGRQDEQALLPEYIKNGMYIRMPFKDSKGNSLYLNMTYLVPWGNLAETGNSLLPGVPMPSDPASTIITALQTGVNPFNNLPIYKATDTGDEKALKFSTFVYQTLMPTFAPEIPGIGITGGYSWEKMADALFSRPDRYGNTRDIPSTFFDVGLGLKTVPINENVEGPKRVMEFRAKINEVKGNIRSISSDQSYVTETQKREQEKKIQKQIEKLQNISNTFNEMQGPQM